MKKSVNFCLLVDFVPVKIIKEFVFQLIKNQLGQVSIITFNNNLLMEEFPQVKLIKINKLNLLEAVEFCYLLNELAEIIIVTDLIMTNSHLIKLKPSISINIINYNSQVYLFEKICKKTKGINLVIQSNKDLLSSLNKIINCTAVIANPILLGFTFIECYGICSW